jgi:UDPglucose 6-dehydrogenase
VGRWQHAQGANDLSSLAIVGTGYVGLSVGACFADLGHDVTCLDINVAKIEALREGRMPIFEPGLDTLIDRGVKAGRLRFSTDYDEAIPGREFIFIAVDTPTGAAGEASLVGVDAAVSTLAPRMSPGAIVVTKSTVPLGTGDLISQILREHEAEKFPVVSNPEFQREGSAVQDFLKPDRVVIGSGEGEAAKRVADLYQTFDCPIIITDLRTAEMIKYASNAFLATRISFINEIGAICEALGADVQVVGQGMELDRRVGRGYLDAGIGWGGSCFPKDVRALEHMASVHGCHPQLLRAVMEINRDARHAAVRKLRDGLLGDLRGRTIAVLGLSFKPNTDDVRDAPAIEIIHLLHGEGAEVRAFDPVAGPRAKDELGDRVTLSASPVEAARGADAVLITTEWNEFRALDWVAILTAMEGNLLVDGRNMHDPDRMSDLGFEYIAMGRSQRSPELEMSDPLTASR